MSGLCCQGAGSLGRAAAALGLGRVGQRAGEKPAWLLPPVQSPHTLFAGSESQDGLREK